MERKYQTREFITKTPVNTISDRSPQEKYRKALVSKHCHYGQLLGHDLRLRELEDWTIGRADIGADMGRRKGSVG
jgi:hypothetical protein